MNPMVETSYQSSDEKSKLFKIVLVGDTQVGKSTLIKALSSTGIDERGYSASLKIILQNSSNPNEVFIGRIFDLRSQRYFPYLHSLFYNKAKGAIILFDVNDWKSFKSISKWRDIIWGHTGKIPLLICGNKSDLRQNNEKQLTIDEINALIKEISKEKKIPYVEISALKRIVAYTSKEILIENEDEIYPTIDAFRQPFVNWMIELMKNEKYDIMEKID